MNVEASNGEQQRLLNKTPSSHSFYNRGKETLRDALTSPSSTAASKLHAKSSPSYVPFTRYARHRSPKLFWLNEFRHWWKSSRLLVRLAGGYAYCRVELNWLAIESVRVWRKKGPKRALKLVKAIGRGGPMREFLQKVHPFTRSLRIVVAVWRTLEAWEGRRHEVGIEEALAFIGNRVSRQIARHATDLLATWIIFPIMAYFRVKDTGIAVVIVLLGVLRACAPYAASFQGSRCGRLLTRGFFHHFYDRWRPLQRIEELNLNFVEGFQEDPILSSAAKEVAVTLGRGPLDDRVKFLEDDGWIHVGDGSGGYNAYERGRLMLHVTPYGPSILNEMPRYVVLENKHLMEREKNKNKLLVGMRRMSVMSSSSEYRIEGFCYSGAFFSPPLWAELKKRYDREILAYQQACLLMGPSQSSSGNPPTDLLTLKKFVETGRDSKKRNKHLRTFKHVHYLVSQLTRHLTKLGPSAPSKVVLYFEGLDCAGKSSTGGLVLEALRDAGYDCDMVAHNRPPTEEEKLQPWINRFKIPISVDKKRCRVWDRGPAGDFVYGALKFADDDTKKERYQEFNEFDLDCRKDDVLLCKMMFVTDRDAIARTLGKRLAHKRMVRDLKEWLDASRPKGGETSVDDAFVREGLEEIENHIDPTDFVAFNMYQENLTCFVNFAKHTDRTGLMQQKKADVVWDNPWLVLNTSDRTGARIALMKKFEKQLDKFVTVSQGAMKFMGALFGSTLGRFDKVATSDSAHVALEVKRFRAYRVVRILIYFILTAFLIYLYVMQTWID